MLDLCQSYSECSDQAASKSSVISFISMFRIPCDYFSLTVTRKFIKFLDKLVDDLICTFQTIWLRLDDSSLSMSFSTSVTTWTFSFHPLILPVLFGCIWCKVHRKPI